MTAAAAAAAAVAKLLVETGTSEGDVGSCSMVGVTTNISVSKGSRFIDQELDKWLVQFAKNKLDGS